MIENIYATKKFPSLNHKVRDKKFESKFSSKVCLTTGDHRAEMAFQALKPFSARIKNAIGDKRVVIKPNNVMVDRQLAATHADTLEGILEFLQLIDVTENVIIAESAAKANTKLIIHDEVLAISGMLRQANEVPFPDKFGPGSQ